MTNPVKTKTPAKKVKSTPKKEVVKSITVPKVEAPIVKLMSELAGLKTLATPGAKTLIEEILKELI